MSATNVCRDCRLIIRHPSNVLAVCNCVDCTCFLRVPPLMEVRRGCSPLAICGFSDPPTRSGRHFPCCKTRNRGVAGANMQWGHFVCPSSSQKRESTAFDLIVRSAWVLLSPGKRVGRSSTPCRKWSQVWGRESERWPKYMQ